MNNRDLEQPLLESQPSSAANDEAVSTIKPAQNRRVHFRHPLIDARPHSQSQRPKSLRPALKKTSTRPTVDDTKEEPQLDSSTAAIIQKIRESYAIRNPLLAERRKLNATNTVLAQKSKCCDRLGCTCCMTSFGTGTGFAAKAAVTASCSPWSALAAIPCCLALSFWKKSKDTEKTIQQNYHRKREIEELLAPQQEMMRCK